MLAPQRCIEVRVGSGQLLEPDQGKRGSAVGSPPAFLTMLRALFTLPQRQTSGSCTVRLPMSQCSTTPRSRPHVMRTWASVGLTALVGPACKE